MKRTITIWTFVVIFLWGLSWFLISNFISEPADRGTFGDMFGAINALFSGLAFAGMIITLLQQKEELSLQRKELEDTRKELEGQKEQQKTQNETLKYQRFETTFFFNLLSAFKEIRDTLSYGTAELSREEVQWYKGIDVFAFFYKMRRKQKVKCVLTLSVEKQY